MWIAQDKNGDIVQYLNIPHIMTEKKEWDTGDHNWHFISAGVKNKNWHDSLINLETHDYKIEDGILMKVEKPKPKRHRNADFIHAWAEGAEIQYKDEYGEWIEASGPSWGLGIEYQIKPKTKTVRFRNYITNQNLPGIVFDNHPDIDPLLFKEWIGDWQEVSIDD